MTCKEVFEKIDVLYPCYLDILEQACNLESPTNNKEAVDAVGNYLASIGMEKGWTIEKFPQERSGDVICITLEGDKKKAPVCLSGHIDTVHPIGVFGTPAVKRDEKNMYGPGVMDCKGGVIAAMLAMNALMECGFSARSVHLLLQSDEENSSVTSDKATIKYICEKSKDAIAFLNLEGAEGNTAVLIRRGILRCRFIVHGKACHSSVSHRGANAITEASHKILQIQNVNKLDGVTCSCNVISGGTKINVVADKCTFEVDIRFPNAEQYEKAQKILHEVASTSYIEGCTCELEEISLRPAMEPSAKNDALLKRMNQIYAANDMPVLEGRDEPSGSDAAYVTQYGIPCVDNLGTEGDYIHSLNEYIKLSSLAESAKRIAAVVCEI